MFFLSEWPCGTSEPDNPGQLLETPSGYTGQGADLLDGVLFA